jgi:elongation factor 1-beta
MAIAGVKIKIMPSSPDVDLEKIKSDLKELIEKNQGKSREFSEEPIAFGLNAIIVFFEWPEEKELEDLENEMKKIENVNSVQVIDLRRLIG